MSDTMGTATVRFNADASQIGTASNQAIGYLNQLESAVATNWWGIRNLGLAFAALPAAVLAGIGASVEAAKHWETAMAGVENATYDASASTEQNKKNLADLQAQLFDIARTKPIATVEIAGVAEAGAKLGVARRDLADFTKATLDLAATTDLSTQDAGTALARLSGFLNVPASAYKNLASSIYETGRATAAGESDITTLAQKIAGAGKLFNLSAGDVIGWAAAMRSANVTSQAAGTQFQRTLIGIQNAVDGGGTKLKAFAAIANENPDTFRKMFRADASGTLEKVIEGLARYERGGKDVVGILAAAGITEQRQITLLTTLAGAQNSTTNSNLKLSNIMKVSNKSMRDGNADAAAAKRQYDTFSGQLKILHNNFFEIAAVIGKTFLPVLKLTVGIVADLVAGFRVMPGPVKLVLAVIIGLAAAVSGLIAAFFLIGGRVIQSISAIRKLGASFAQSRAEAQAKTNVLNELAAALSNAAQAEGVAAAATQEATNASAAAAVATAQRLEVMAALSTAEAAQSAAEAEYTTSEIELANARIEMARAEQEAFILRSQGLADGNALVLAATERLDRAYIEHKLNTRALVLANTELLASAEKLTASTDTEAVLSEDAAIALDRQAEAALAAAAAQGELATATGASTKVVGEAATANVVSGQALAGSTAEAGFLSSAMSGVSEAFGYAAIAFAAFTVISGIMGGEQRKREAEARKQEEAVSKLTDAYVEGDSKGQKTIQNWIRQQVVQQGLIGTAKQLGISYRQLSDIISGAASPKDYIAFGNKVQEGSKKGVDGAARFAAEVRILNREMANSKDAALAQGASLESLTGKSDKAAAAAKKLAQAQADGEITKQQATATTDLVGAMFDETSAAFEVKDAEQALTDARKAASRQADVIANAEISLARARQAAAQDSQNIEDAERSLATARVRQDEAVIKAEDSLASARDAHADAIDKVSAAQDVLNDLMNPKGPEALRSALLDLADAEKGLRDAQQKSADAQWQLNYLREEGAGARDIQKAKNDQKDAALEVAAATEKQGKAQEALHKLQDPASRAAAIAKAERDLAAARRNVTDTAIAENEAERNLSDARRDKTENRLVLAAERDLADARLTGKANAIAVRDAESALSDARSKDVNGDVLKAQLAYEQSLYRQAGALAEVRKQLHLIAGDEFTASDQAHAVADGLKDIIKHLPAGPEREKLQKFLDLLQGTKNVPKGLDAADNTDTTPNASPTSGFGSNDPLGKFKQAIGKPSVWSVIKKTLTKNIDGITSSVGATIGLGFGPLGALLGAGIGLAVGEGIKALIKYGPGMAKAVGRFFTRIPGYIASALGAIGRFFSRLPGQAVRGLEALGRGILKFVEKLPGRLAGAVGFILGWMLKSLVYAVVGFVRLNIWLVKLAIKIVSGILSGLEHFGESILQAFADAFSYLAKHLPNAIRDVVNFFKDLPGNIVKELEHLPGQITHGFRAAFQTLSRDLPKWIHNALNFFRGIGRSIMRILNGAVTWLVGIGGDIIHGFAHGFRKAWPGAADWFSGLKDRVLNLLTHAISWLTGVGGDIISGLWGGMQFVWGGVTGWIGGLWTALKKKVVAGFKIVKGVSTHLLDIGKQIFQGLWDGFKHIWTKIIDWLASKIHLLPKFIKDYFNIKSPSRLMHDIGLNIAKGLENGLRTGMDGAVKQFQDSVKSINPDAIRKQFADFGIDGYDVSAYVNPQGGRPHAGGVPFDVPRAPTPPPASTGSAGTYAPTYQLTAVTEADPAKIVGEFTWAERGKVRTRGLRP